MEGLAPGEMLGRALVTAAVTSGHLGRRDALVCVQTGSSLPLSLSYSCGSMASGSARAVTGASLAPQVLLVQSTRIACARSLLVWDVSYSLDVRRRCIQLHFIRAGFMRALSEKSQS